jgi:hypothetical protein
MEGVDFGFERDSFTDKDGIRWWFVVTLPGHRLRNQAARQDVIDRGFRFARGGLAGDEDSARAHIRAAAGSASFEISRWQRQPSHYLAADGSLVPLDELTSSIAELTA